MPRKRNPGQRTKSGRLSRAVSAIPHDKGCDRIAQKFSRFGTDGADAIGRAYATGLLGEGQAAKAILDTARAIFRAYWSWYQIGPINCTLADRKSGAWIDNDADREARQEEWLNRMLRNAGPQGRDKRRWFEQVVVDFNPDFGPDWLDRLINNQGTAQDRQRMAVVIDVLAECAEVKR